MQVTYQIQVYQVAVGRLFTTAPQDPVMAARTYKYLAAKFPDISYYFTFVKASTESYAMNIDEFKTKVLNEIKSEAIK